MCENQSSCPDLNSHSFSPSFFLKKLFLTHAVIIWNPQLQYEIKISIFINHLSQAPTKPNLTFKLQTKVQIFGIKS